MYGNSCGGKEMAIIKKKNSRQYVSCGMAEAQPTACCKLMFYTSKIQLASDKIMRKSCTTYKILKQKRIRSQQEYQQRKHTHEPHDHSPPAVAHLDSQVFQFQGS